MFVSSPLPTLRPSAAASSSTSRPPIIQPVPVSFRERWLADKKFKLDRSPDLKNGNGFGPSLLDNYSPYANSLPAPFSSRSASPKLSLPAVLSFYSPSKRLLSSPRALLAIFVILSILLLRQAVHQLAPQILLTGANAMQTSDLLQPVQYTYPFSTRVADERTPFSFWSRNSALNTDDDDVPVFEEGPPKHQSTREGLLLVDSALPAIQHPIYQLIEEAKEEWDAKVARQSTTLEEAVVEYKRRNNGLNPPKGFDRWWNYVQTHNVQLPDEYDRINIDLAPFRGISPSLLRARVEALQNPTAGHETFTVSVNGGQASTSHVTYDASRIGGADDRRDGQLELIREVSEWLPDFEAVYSIHDSPTRFISYGHKQDLEYLFEDGEYLDPLAEVDTDGHSWAAACPYGTPLRKNGEQPIPEGKSFIQSHTASMDLCNHPSVPSLHGLTLGVTPEPQSELLPMFSLSKTSLHTDILGIPVEQWLESTSDDVPAWSDKTNNRLLWRGRNTGGSFTKDVNWRNSHRARLTATSGDDVKARIGVLPAPGSVIGEKDRSLGNATMERNLGRLNQAMMDIGLAYEPIQCTVEDGTCAQIAEELTFRPVLTFEQEVSYRYILDVDGNAWSARFKRLLSTGSLVLKSTIFPEWWNDRIQPWYHYVPVKVDYEDVYDIMSFFRGTDAEGKEGEDKLAEQIARQGLEWSHEYWRKEDMVAYMSRLYLEYARLVSPNRHQMDFELPTSEPTSATLNDAGVDEPF